MIIGLIIVLVIILILFVLYKKYKRDAIIRKYFVYLDMSNVKLPKLMQSDNLDKFNINGNTLNCETKLNNSVDYMNNVFKSPVSVIGPAYNVILGKDHFGCAVPFLLKGRSDIAIVNYKPNNDNSDFEPNNLNISASEFYV